MWKVLRIIDRWSFYKYEWEGVVIGGLIKLCMYIYIILYNLSLWINMIMLV